MIEINKYVEAYEEYLKRYNKEPLKSKRTYKKIVYKQINVKKIKSAE